MHMALYLDVNYYIMIKYEGVLDAEQLNYHVD